MEIVVRIEVGEFLDVTGLRLQSVADDDFLVASESADELKVVLGFTRSLEHSCQYSL
jgi:hypothetical protein